MDDSDLGCSCGISLYPYIEIIIFFIEENPTVGYGPAYSLTTVAATSSPTRPASQTNSQTNSQTHTHTHAQINNSRSFARSVLPPNGGVQVIEPAQLPAGILDILLGLHAHVEDGAILAGADDLLVHGALAALALGPQPAEADLELRHLGQGLGVELARAGLAVLAHGAGAFRRGRERFLAAHAGLGFFGELHQPPQAGRGDGDAAGVLPRQ